MGGHGPLLHPAKCVCERQSFNPSLVVSSLRCPGHRYHAGLGCPHGHCVLASSSSSSSSGGAEVSCFVIGPLDRSHTRQFISLCLRIRRSLCLRSSVRPAGRAYVPLAAIASNDAHFSCVARHENRQTDGQRHTQTQREGGRLGRGERETSSC